MDDDAAPLRDHLWQQSPVETNGGHEVLIQLTPPHRIVERRESASGRR
jgi:hypothetical protein